jgi:hypothetical protein
MPRQGIKFSDFRGMWLVWVRREMRTEFLWGILKERCHFEVLEVHARIILTKKPQKGRVWGELIGQRTWKSGGML